MFNSHRQKQLCALAGILLTVPIYAADKFPEFPKRPASEYRISTHLDDVTLGLEPLDSIGDQESYFHLALTLKGFLPVFVAIHNSSQSDSLIFDSSKIVCDEKDQKENGPRADTKAAKTSEAFELAAIPFGGIIAAPAIAEMFAHASRIQQNLMLKEIHSQTLPPGGSAYGFVYVATTKKAGRGAMHISVPMTWQSTAKESTINLSF